MNCSLSSGATSAGCTSPCARLHSRTGGRSALSKSKKNKNPPLSSSEGSLFLFGSSLSELTVRTEHIDNLVDVHLLHVLTSGLQVLARIEVIGMLCQILADGSSHSQTRVGVDVDLADSTLSGLAELLLGDTNCIGQLAAILVDGVNLVLRN